jgi:hypothetical protein
MPCEMIRGCYLRYSRAKEAIVSQRWICAQAALGAALLILVGGLRPAAANEAYSVALYMSCGDRMDYCLPICDATVPEGFALGRCYDRCSVDAGICEARRIPVPGRRIRR